MQFVSRHDLRWKFAREIYHDHKDKELHVHVYIHNIFIDREHFQWLELYSCTLMHAFWSQFQCDKFWNMELHTWAFCNLHTKMKFSLVLDVATDYVEFYYIQNSLFVVCPFFSLLPLVCKK